MIDSYQVFDLGKRLQNLANVFVWFCIMLLPTQGLVALTSTAMVWEWKAKSDHHHHHQRMGSGPILSSSSLFLSLFLISLGQGGYNPCLQAFGADQLAITQSDHDKLPSSNKEEEDEDINDQISNEKKKSLFFKWWYFGICTGSLLGVSLMSYLQDTFGWGLGFAIPTIAMAASVAPFLCGSRFYTVINKQPKSSAAGININPINNLIQSIKATASKLQEKPLCSQDSDQSSLVSNNPNNAVVDPIEETKSVLRLLPIWGMLLMFAIIFQQPATFFTKQGMTMKRNIGNHFMIPPATLQSAINVSIILLMPFYDKIVIPIFRVITRSDTGINVMQRMGFGMFLSIIAMSIAAVVETKRLEISRRILPELLHHENSSSAPQITVPLSIFWLLPQYIILGVSDVFTVVGMQEFFYSEVPSKMKTMGMALHLSVFGVGSFLSALLIAFIEILTSDSEGKHSWFTDDMNEARLDKYYWLLAFSSALSLFFFAISYKYYNRGNQ
ncbi:Proton-dependent oligopeptide transporter family [Macleaya cordata]|uniref:Proton-dependent oligopeptide transporter family n=1 Tax=Macleaya cordata TaxID=56857 RepID=A0A200QV77_MACCD|nr:Proton-dependent oligopeptide transporter family [Macleaya cordata]